MTNPHEGAIEIGLIDIMGGMALDHQRWIVTACDRAAGAFLRRNAKHFDPLLHMGSHWYSLSGPRIAKFRAYAESKGFQVLIGRRY
jgi:hypothetical protein